MKLRLALPLIALMPMLAHAEEGDRQSMMTISSTDPLTITSGTAARSPELPSTPQTRGVRVVGTQDMHCKTGSSIVMATVSDTLFPAKVPEYIKIQPSTGNYVSCIADSTTGKVWVDPVRAY